MNRVFVRSGGPLQHRRWLAALKQGRSFATNGPLLEFTLQGHGPGDEIALPAGGRELPARVVMRSNVPVDHLEVVANGEVLRTIGLTGDRREVDTTLRLPADRSGWYLLRAYSDQAHEPVLDLYPYATTSPIYLTVGGAPVRSTDDAEYFIAWIDRLRGAVEAHQEWNTPAEKARTLETLARARTEFERRAATTP
jgi:TolB protein